MNFKSWLLTEEEEKDINLSNHNLTSTIPPLNTSLSNPSLTTTIPPLNASVSNPNLTTTKISSREIASNKKLEALAIRYKQLGTGEYPREFKSFLNKKRMAYRDYKKADGTKSTSAIWYPSDIEVAEKNGLPKNWMLPVDYEKESNDRLKELAIYYGRNGFRPSQYEKDKSLAFWLYDKEKKNPNPYEASDKKTWADMVELFKTPDLIDPDTQKPFLYTNLPNDWREVKPVGKNQGFLLKLKNQKNSSKNLEKLAYYYGRNGSAPSKVDFNKENRSLANWHTDKRYRPNIHEESDNKTWADMVALSKTWDKEEFPYELPEKWLEVKPAGKKSLGEKYVANILKELKIKYETQDKDLACKNKICLRFDFSITHNGRKYFVEYNGKQHYVPVYFGSTEVMTDQEKANHALENFKYVQKNDAIKYEHFVKGNLPFIVIPYWLDKSSNIIKSTIIEFLKTNEFNKTFAIPNVPDEYKVKHDKMLKITQCFASGEVNCKELFKKQKTTFEQFLINKNFINI